MPRRAPIRGYRGPAWDRYIDKEKEPKDDTAKVLEQARKDKEHLMDQATTAALGGDYEAAESFAEAAGWPIKRRQTVAPPEDSAGVVRGPQGRAMFVRQGGGAMAPGDQTADPAQLMETLQARFAAEKGLPTATGTMSGKLSGSERLVGGPDVEYPERVGVDRKPAEEKFFGEGEWPQTYYNDAGETWVVKDEKEAKEAIDSGYGPAKPDKKEKDEKYEKRTLYKGAEEWEVRSPTEEIQATSAGFTPRKPGETKQSDKDKAAASKNRVLKLKSMMETLLTPYRGADKLIDQLLKSADTAQNFAELADLAKNGYERLLAKSNAAKDGPEKERALQVLQRYGELLNRMLAEEDLPPVGGEKPTEALGTETPTAGDYINNALGGTQL